MAISPPSWQPLADLRFQVTVTMPEGDAVRVEEGDEVDATGQTIDVEVS